MVLSRDVLAPHIAYTRWASGRLVESAGALTSEQLTREFGIADKSVLGTPPRGTLFFSGQSRHTHRGKSLASCGSAKAPRALNSMKSAS